MRLNAILKISLIILISFGLTSSLLAQIGRGRLHGKVEDEQDNPIAGAKIVGHNKEFGITFEVYTDKKGKWTKSGLRGGQWEITASAEGYMYDTVKIDVKQMQRNPLAEFKLKKIKIKTDMPFLQEDTSRALFKEGNQLYEDKKFDEAIATFQKFLEENPTIYQVHINVGNCYRDKGEYDKAIEEYDLVLAAVQEKKGTLEGDISAGKALANIGECHLKKGDNETAHKFLKDAVDNYPEDENLAYNVGELFFSNNQMDEAIKYFELAAKINPEWAPPFLKLGYAYSNTASYKKAIQNFRKFLELEPDTPQAQDILNFINALEKMKK